MILDQLLKLLLDLLYSLCDNYGIAIILLSLCVSIIMFPLFIISENIQKKTGHKQKHIQQELDKFKNLNNRQEKFFYTQEVYRKSGYSPIHSMKGMIGLLIQIPFFIAAFKMIKEYKSLNFISFGPIENLFQPDALINLGIISINVLPILMSIINIFAGFLYTKDKKERNQIIGISLVFLILLYNQPAALILYWTMNNVFSIPKNWAINKLFVIFNKSSQNKKAPYLPYLPKQKKNSSRSKISDLIAITAILYILQFLFISIPANIYTSSPDEFEQSLFNILSFNLTNLFFLLTIVAVIIILSKDKIKSIINIIVLSIIFFLFFNQIIFGRDFGKMDGFVFTQITELSTTIERHLLEIFFFILSLAISFRVFTKYKKPILTLLILLNIISICGLPFQEIFKEKEVQKNYDTIDYENIMGYSKKDKNIVILILDMFSGSYVPKLLEEFPYFKSSFSGFTAYPNTLSISYNTVCSVPSLNMGWAYTPEAINNSGKSQLKNIIKSYDEMIDKMQKNNYKVSIVGASYYHSYKGSNDKLNNKHVSNAKISDFSNNKDSQQKLAIPQEYYSKILFKIALFNLSPSIAKEYIYNNGKWNSKFNTLAKRVMKEKIFFDKLQHNNNTNQQSNTFKVFHSFLTHEPYRIDVNGDFIHSNHKTKEFKKKANAYTSAKFNLDLLIPWINWLKENDVYDNTKIIIVSDHGNSVEESPVFKQNGNNINLKLANRLHALLMVKDFNQNDNLKTDNRFMSNADVPAIVASAFDDPKSFTTAPDPTKLKPDPNRKLPTYFSGTWQWKKIEKCDHINYSKYLVTKNLFDGRNWERTQ